MDYQFPALAVADVQHADLVYGGHNRKAIETWCRNPRLVRMVLLLNGLQQLGRPAKTLVGGSLQPEECPFTILQSRKNRFFRIGMGKLAENTGPRYVAGKLVQVEGNLQSLLAGHPPVDSDLPGESFIGRHGFTST